MPLQYCWHCDTEKDPLGGFPDGDGHFQCADCREVARREADRRTREEAFRPVIRRIRTICENRDRGDFDELVRLVGRLLPYVRV